jgi:aminobenzoyl-glutamate utilization protein B
MDTAFIASAGHGSPVIGILGELDALPNLSQQADIDHSAPLVYGAPGHGCGHNLLGCGGMECAYILKKYFEEHNIEGTVKYFSCPAEEGGVGKVYMIHRGAFDDVDFCVNWHPGAGFGITHDGKSIAIQNYRFHGIASHAAGMPEMGRSALDALELFNIGIQFIREHMTKDTYIHYAITDTGGVSPNVVQDHAAVLYMVRANKVKDSVKLLKRVDKIADGAALMTETTYDRVFIDGTAELVPNFTLEKLLYKNFEEAGLPPFTEEEKAFADALRKTCPAQEAPGNCADISDEIAAFTRKASNNGQKGINDFLVPLFHSTSFFPGSTDVGDVSWQTPTAQIHVTAFVNGAPGHSWQNVSTGGSSIGHKALLHAGKVLSIAAIDLYEKPDCLQKARDEFEKRAESGYVCPIEEDAVPIAL